MCKWLKYDIVGENKKLGDKIVKILEKTMKIKLYIYLQPNYLPRTAIVRERKQFIKIAFAVHLSAVISAERYRSDSGALKSAVPVFVYLCIVLIVHKYRQSAAQSCLKNNLLLNRSTDRSFENRWSRYKEPSKNKAEAYRVYVEHLFLRSDAGDARIFSKEHEHGLKVSKHIFVGNSRLVTAMTHADNHGDTTEQTEKRYYYHADHLQSAQFITNAKGEQYEHIEYTPYGELWIEETAPGIDKLPFRFTGKELDEETGLYYYGARYLDPKYSRWLSGDPALNDYIPKAPIDDDAKKHNENLPGMGGVFNVVNLHVYHYAGNNPIKYTDPDGRNMEDDLAKSLGNTSKKQGVDLNLFTANPKQDLYDAHEPEFGNMRQAASRAYKYAAFFYVAAHGNRVNASSCGEDGSLNYEDRAFLDPKDLAEMIKSNPNYNGQPVVLWICNSGQDPQNIDNSQDCFAKKVADALGEGAIVIASTGFVNFKSGIFIQSNTSGNRKTRIPYTSVDSGEQYKFIGGK